MTFEQIKARVMFQTNNDQDDLGDYLPFVERYANDGYDRLLYALAKAHLGAVSDETGEAENPALEADDEEPHLPGWAHAAVADYATYLVYRNGNPQKQQRGLMFLRAFQEIEARLQAESGGRDKFINIYP